MHEKIPCKYCERMTDRRGIRKHEAFCDKRPKAPTTESPKPESKPEAKQEPPSIPAPTSAPTPTKPQVEEIVIRQDFTEVPPMQPETEVINTPTPAAPTPKADIFDFDAEDCANAYGAVMECGCLIFANKETSLPEDRVRKRGAALHKIMLKYGLTLQYMDLLFFGLGVASDISLLMHENKPQQEAVKTDNTPHEIIEQKPAPDKPRSLLSAGAVKAP